MFRNARLGLALLSVLVVAAACGEVPTATGDGQLRVSGARASILPGTCTDLAQLKTLAQGIFTANSSPNYKSVEGKLKNLDGLVRKNKIAEAQAHANEIVAFTLKKHNQGGLAGTDAQVKEFTNAVLCFAGIDIDVEQPDNTFYILPSDQPQVITNLEGNAGISFAANPVSEPTLVSIEVIDDVFGPGEGPLDTKLDQYPGYIHITKTSETNAALAKPAVVAVCATGAIPTDVRARLRLGHGATAGFEITAPAPADFLACPIGLTQAPTATGWARVAELLMPSKAHAFQMEFGGGVGGTVTEFSPFAPVDPVLEFGGGVGGTVTEFTRMGLGQSALLEETLTLMGACPAPIEGAQGSPLRDECRPSVTIRTRLGTPFVGVPVDWSVTQGGGVIGANTGTCGTLGATASTVTGPNGGAGICWTLGAVGANQVVATPSLGGDALDGVTFAPASFTFDAIANPPAGLAWSLQPPAVVQTRPGFPIGLTVVDKNGERVFAYGGKVRIALNQNTFVDGSTATGGDAVAGYFSFDINIPTVGTGYQLLASAPFMTAPAAHAASSTFEVVAGVPHTISITAGNGQTGPAGTLAPVAATVHVTDAFGNAVAGAVVNWSLVFPSGGSVTPSTATDAGGNATTAWMFGAGAMTLRARLAAGSLAHVTFTATGTTP